MDPSNNVGTMLFLGAVMESSFYGLYCVVFAVHMRIRSKNQGGSTNIAIYPLSFLFVLCTSYCIIDITRTLYSFHLDEGSDSQKIGLAFYNMNIASTALYCAITFLAQGILIYRCWLMWGKQLLVISIPLILAWATFGTSLAMIAALIQPASSRVAGTAKVSYPLSTAAYSTSLGVNAILATLLAVKTFMLQRKVQQSCTVRMREVQAVLYDIISIINDSGMLMLACQVIWLSLFLRKNVGFFLARGPILVIYGLTPTLIFQRISPYMGQLSSNDNKEKLVAERSTKIRFAS